MAGICQKERQLQYVLLLYLILEIIPRRPGITRMFPYKMFKRKNKQSNPMQDELSVLSEQSSSTKFDRSAHKAVIKINKCRKNQYSCATSKGFHISSHARSSLSLIVLEPKHYKSQIQRIEIAEGSRSRNSSFHGRESQINEARER